MRITTTTICGTDLHILKGDLPLVTDGRILGHEGIGVIEQIGTGVTKFHVGDKVIISCVTACLKCDFCRKQMYSHCRHGPDCPPIVSPLGSGAPQRGRFSIPRIATLAVAVLAGSALVSAIAVHYVRAVDASKGKSNRSSSLVVLPMENLSGDKDQDYFADGMTDDLIANLAKIRSLRVVSRSTAMAYKGTLKPLPQIASELNVDAVVEGTVMRVGNRVRITAELVQVSTDQHLWADT